MSWRQPNPRGLDLQEPADGAAPAGAGPPPLATWRKVVLGLVLAALAAGLVAVVVARANGGDDDTASPTAPPTQVQTSTPSTASSSQPPPLLNTGDDPDWAAMVRSMLAYDAWLRRNPRPELLQAWMRPSSPLYPEGMQTLENLANGNWRYDPAPCEPLTAEIVRLTSRHGTSALVFVRFPTIPACRGFGRAGNVVLDQAAQPANSAIWTLLQDPDGRWRFEKAERL